MDTQALYEAQIFREEIDVVPCQEQYLVFFDLEAIDKKVRFGLDMSYR